MRPENSKFRTQIPHLSQFYLTSCVFDMVKKVIKKGCKYLIYSQYPGRDLNPHNRNGHRILSPACLPVPPPGQYSEEHFLQFPLRDFCRPAVFKAAHPRKKKPSSGRVISSEQKTRLELATLTLARSCSTN